MTSSGGHEAISSTAIAGASRPPARRPLAGRVGATRAGRVRRACSSAGWAARRSAATSPPPRSATGSSKPLGVVRGYELPAWTPPDRAVLCSSYSGNTEETLACYDAAEALGAQRVVATTGGDAGRGRAPRRRPGHRPARRPPAARRGRLHVRGRRRGRGALRRRRTRSAPRSTPPPRTSRPQRDALAERAAEIAARDRRLGAGGLRRRPHGARSPTAGRRQINENAKLPAFSHELPEVDHNEIVGWEGAGDGARLQRVFLADRDQHPRERRAIRADRRADRARRRRTSIPIETEGETPDRAPAVGGHARRPRLAPARRAGAASTRRRSR